MLDIFNGEKDFSEDSSNNLSPTFFMGLAHGLTYPVSNILLLVVVIVDFCNVIAL